MKVNRILLIFIGVITALSIMIDLPRVPLRVNLGSVRWDKTIGDYDLDFRLGNFRIKKDLKLKKGLDLQGGVHVVLETDMSKIAEADREAALQATRSIIEKRINFFGVTEPNIQTSRVGGEYRILVELPGVTDTKQALELIGKTAQLDFREQDEATEAAQPFKKTDLSGADLKRSGVQFNPNTSEPLVGLEFTSQGAKKFEEITRRNVGKPLAIYIDDLLITAPRVNEVITGGEAVISGQFTVEEAKRLSIQLNSGALPVPIKVQEQRNIGATLGQESVRKSINAGVIGLFLVVFFIVAYYGKLGILAAVALFIYGLMTLALYKLIPVTLTLAGIAGFLLSVGMAVDANILIFERLKEELRAKKPLRVAIELGFGRAWDSIRDANINTLLICFILFNPFNWAFLNTSGIVRGFAVTLGLGIFISLFTGIVVTRTLIRVFYR